MCRYIITILPNTGFSGVREQCTITRAKPANSTPSGGVSWLSNQFEDPMILLPEAPFNTLLLVIFFKQRLGCSRALIYEQES